ncbi:L-histidine N(alpha)-methyltransferase [Marinactinospora thermotolerans]|uniref:Histidine N-alpha-methyltransferase n=1 Tax=Marinactinospora thermotolerans DSM 45154 TaxID=1122192 RepID=A0A1T4RKQ2_9ACTN|nr:L-histidine N(alpha)-methyltransferase [Marinactinospora thermotolerans]SKA16555.1 L-histidine Nalpha-methyltransferase [Marinactinospora thermotolerans DSM 45154]
MFTIDHHLTVDDLAKALRHDVHDGLTATPKTLPPKWFYDERGSALFEEITRLPEYYPTRAERSILEARAAEIAEATGADHLVELGSGSGEKTRLLLDALRAAGTLRGFVPVDVSGDFLETAARRVAEEYPSVTVHAVVADFERHLNLLPSGGRRLIAMLGSTIGNQTPGRRHAFLADLRQAASAGDGLLLGLDLVKDPDRLVAAYDDAAGVTAEFNRNVLRVIDRELDADADPEAFAHVALWNPEAEWIEMHLRAGRAMRVRLRALDLVVHFERGETVRTEISAKFRPDGARAELAAAGFETTHWWTDPGGDFALLLARPV